MRTAAIASGGCEVTASTTLSNYGVDRLPLNYKATDVSGVSGWYAGTHDANQWIQVKFKGCTVLVDEIQLQGRADWDNWVKKYKLKATEDGTTWFDVNGGEVFTGNTDGTTIVSNKLQNPIKCTAIRICPTEWQGSILMRCEVFYRNL